MQFLKSLMILMILMITTLTFVAAADKRGRPKKESCGEGELFNRGEESFWLRNDNICMQVVGTFKAARIYKGCQCKFFNSYACGGGDRKTGLVVEEGSKTETRIGTFEEWAKANWYVCRRF